METAPREPFDCNVSIPGWRLHVAHLILSVDRDLGNVMEVALRGAHNHLRRSFPEGKLLDNSTVMAIRENLVAMGHKPGRTPPCSESLLTGFLEDQESIRGSLAWEFLALLTIKSLAPWSVLDRQAVDPPLDFRYGKQGESIPSPAGALDCEGLPVLADSRGVRATPWTHVTPDSLRDCKEPVFVCYLPERLFRRIQPKSHMGRAIWMTWAYRFVFERTCTHRPPAS
jgi:DNA/RNA-binding domain of Phe-tRNA-synthetase-like protein